MGRRVGLGLENKLRFVSWTSSLSLAMVWLSWGQQKAPCPPPPAPYSNSESVSPGQAHIWVSSLTFLADLEEAVFSI